MPVGICLRSAGMITVSAGSQLAVFDVTAFLGDKNKALPPQDF